MKFRRILACALLAVFPSLAAAQSAGSPGVPTRVDGITRLIAAIDKATAAGDADALRALGTTSLRAAQLSEFVQSMTFPRPTQSAVKERDRAATKDGKIRLLVETFTERAGEGRVASWRFDVEPVGSSDGPWAIASIERLTVVSGLYRLELDTTREYDVHNLQIAAPDLMLSVPHGSAFLSKTPDGPTALVVIGTGHAEFTPKPEAERGQVRIFAGSESFRADFKTLFVRFNPDAYERAVTTGSLKPRATPE